MGAMPVRTLVLVGTLGLAMGWALGGRLQPSQPDGAAEGGRSSGPRPLGTAPPADAAPFTEQLRLKLEQKPRAPRPDRNPFTFAARRPAAPAARSTAAAPDSVDAVAEPPPDPPKPGAEFRLAGMASTEGADGTVWTAMVHDGRGLLYVQKGDALPGGFEVVDLQESSITLRDSAGGERTLRLR
jgi:hypothetical protein